MDETTNATPNAGGAGAGAQVRMTDEQLKSLREGIIEAAAAKALDELKRGADPLKGITNGNGVSAPASFVKSLPYNPYEHYTDNFKGLGFARMVRMKAAAAVERKSVDEIAANWQKATGGVLTEMALKGLNASNLEDGGALIDTVYGEFIELLRDRAVVRGSGVRVLPLRGNLTMRRQTGSTTAHYVGEKPSGDITSKPQFGATSIYSKKMMAGVAMSNDLIREGGPQADIMTREDLVLSAQLREDLAFIRGDGTENTPKGIYHWTRAANKFNANATVNLDNITADLARAELILDEANIPTDGAFWLSVPRTFNYLGRVRDGNGNLVYKPELDQGKLNGKPIRVTNQIPKNLGGSSNATELYLVVPGQHIIYDEMGVEINAYPGAAYVGPNGVESGLSNDETFIQLITKHDFFQRHDSAAVVIEAVTWGA